MRGKERKRGREGRGERENVRGRKAGQGRVLVVVIHLCQVFLTLATSTSFVPKLAPAFITRASPCLPVHTHSHTHILTLTRICPVGVCVACFRVYPPCPSLP